MNRTKGTGKGRGKSITRCPRVPWQRLRRSALWRRPPEPRGKASVSGAVAVVPGGWPVLLENDQPAEDPAAQTLSSSNVSCSACTASSMYLRSISTEILISLVVMTLMLTFSAARAANILAATPT